MSLLEAVYSDYSKCSDDFKNGLEYLIARSFYEAAEQFQLAFRSSIESDPYRNTYISYFGISKLMHGDNDGIKFCRMAGVNEWKNADVFLNLARAELFCENRLNTFLAIEKGFDIDRCHIGLSLLHKKIGVRKHSILPFLSRKNRVNQFLGRRLRRV